MKTQDRHCESLAKYPAVPYLHPHQLAYPLS
ncbi:Uncharacterised protein [Vibrio cholerae]|nr:Uncharacterised protein [Vibrio cholerae]CSI92861.1 Uncharacterised protein [Vibrio cholerae]